MKRLLAAILAVAAVVFAFQRPPAAPAIAVATASPRSAIRRGRLHRPTAAPGGVPILVYVVGAVAHPGLYRLAPDARVDAAVRSAGGLSAGADPAGVNLAAHASDGDEIDVPLVGQTPHASQANHARGSRSKKAPRVVNVNNADTTALAQVPGIGRAIAARIVAVRSHDGIFTTYDELLDVAGMTQARLDRAQPYLRL